MGVKVMQWWEELEYAKDDARAQGSVEGSAKTLIETCREFGVTNEEIKERLMNKLALSEEEAENYMKQYYIEN